MNMINSNAPSSLNSSTKIRYHNRAANKGCDSRRLSIGKCGEVQELQSDVGEIVMSPNVLDFRDAVQLKVA